MPDPNNPAMMVQDTSHDLIDKIIAGNKEEQVTALQDALKKEWKKQEGRIIESQEVKTVGASGQFVLGAQALFEVVHYPYHLSYTRIYPCNTATEEYFLWQYADYCDEWDARYKRDVNELNAYPTEPHVFHRFDIRRNYRTGKIELYFDGTVEEAMEEYGKAYNLYIVREPNETTVAALKEEGSPLSPEEFDELFGKDKLMNTYATGWQAYIADKEKRDETLHTLWRQEVEKDYQRREKAVKQQLMNLGVDPALGDDFTDAAFVVANQVIVEDTMKQYKKEWERIIAQGETEYWHNPYKGFMMAIAQHKLYNDNPQMDIKLMAVTQEAGMVYERAARTQKLEWEDDWEAYLCGFFVDTTEKEIEEIIDTLWAIHGPAIKEKRGKA